MVEIECGKFNEWVDRIAMKMKAKFRQKAVQGYTGWDDPYYKSVIKSKLTKHVNRYRKGDEGQLIDIMNLTAFLIAMDFEEKALKQEG